MSNNSLLKMKTHALQRNHSLNLACFKVKHSIEEMTVKVKDNGYSSNKQIASKEINYGPTRKLLPLME
jgi:hypothetical protein